MIDYSRNQLTFIVTVSSEYAAQKFELLLQNWQEPKTPQQKKADKEKE